jgi:sensor histidine kinase YesM
MIKDTILRLLFIPLLGLSIPYLSGIISYRRYSAAELGATHLYFIFMSWCIWSCSAWLHHKIRSWFRVDQNIFEKIATVSLSNALFGGAIAGILTLIWYRISREVFAWNPYLLCIVLCLLAVIVFTLVYEILYLSQERQLDTKRVGQLDHEKSVAEMRSLKNELEPHFIFNSLNTLSHLILHDSETAHAFNSKLASVYKYFLMNKDRDLISLGNELEFIDNYFFLLQLRHDNKLQLGTNLKKNNDSQLMILPFALQVTVENAIKHNEFTEEKPLQISIELQGDYLLVKNNKKIKAHPEESTGIGLKNLSARYRLFCQKDISIEMSDNEFIVKLPLIQQNL